MNSTPARKGRPSRKALILSTTETLLREHGIGSVTTRAVADAVPCSEGAIYVHFEDRLALLLEVIQASLPDMLVPIHALRSKTGKSSPEQNLVTAMEGLSKFHDRVVPMLCSLISESTLLERFRQSLAEKDKGPHRGIQTLADYIAEEQSLGRIDPAVDARTAATALMSSSFFHCFTQRLFGAPSKFNARKFVRLAIRSDKATKPTLKNLRR